MSSNIFSRLYLLVSTLSRLPLLSLFRVLFYRVKFKFRFLPKNYLQFDSPTFFTSEDSVICTDHLSISFDYFGHTKFIFQNPPNWHISPSTLLPYPNKNDYWYDVLDSWSYGDLKEYWEFSRFKWVPQLAASTNISKSEKCNLLNKFIVNWVKENPPYHGVNWTCGQEAAIRVIHLVIGNIILGLNFDNPGFIRFIESSAYRISKTFGYALGQDNNHGSSEACALYISGLILDKIGVNDGNKYYLLGRKFLLERLNILIQSDGSSCQYSVNYHRANLETYCTAEIIRRYFGDSTFGLDAINRINLGAFWLNSLVCPDNGYVPTIGANDGSYINNIFCEDYRDYRPTVSLCYALFSDSKIYPDDLYIDRRANLFNIIPNIKSTRAISNTILTFPLGGLHVFKKFSYDVFLQFPSYNFRPSQADFLNICLRLNGKDIFVDAGTYSYVGKEFSDFKSIKYHNSIQFDDSEPVPSLGQFLYAAWPVVLENSYSKIDAFPYVFDVSYNTYSGCFHKRSLNLLPKLIHVTDFVSNFSNKAVLRWRFSSRGWIAKKSGDSIIVINQNFPDVTITITSTVAFSYCFTESFVSYFYGSKKSIDVLEVTLLHSGSIFTVIEVI